jgi:hypothetical protein
MKTPSLVTVLRIGCVVGEAVTLLALLALLTLIPFSDTLVAQKGARFAIYTGINRSLNLGFGVSFGSPSDTPGAARYPGSLSLGPFRLKGETSHPLAAAPGGASNEVLIEDTQGMVVFRDTALAAGALSNVKWPIVVGVLFTDLAGLAILELFRRMLLSAERGNVFTHDNIRNVRLVGILIIASSAAKLLSAGMLLHRMASFLASRMPAGGPSLETSVDGNAAAVVTGLMILVLAQVFRHGLALKEDSDLTI